MIRYKIGSYVSAVIGLLFLCGIISHDSRADQPFSSVPTETIGERSSLDRTSSSLPPAVLSVTFAIKSDAVTNVADYVSSLTDSSSVNYHHWLTAEQFGEKFGANQADIDSVTKYLTQSGFTRIKLWRNRLFVTAHATAATVESALKVRLQSYVRSQSEIAKGYTRTYYAPDSEPTIDADVASKLNGIFGLSNIGQHRPTFAHSLATADSSNAALNPYDLGQIYNGSALHAAGFEGSGVTIAIFSPTTFSASDVSAFLSANDLTAKNIKIVNVNGGTRDSSNLEEGDIDIETVAGQAPDANINVYEGPNDGSLDIFNQMADDQPSIVTESYGSDENSVSQSFADSYETLRQQMAAEGISIIVASGDNGAYDSNYQTTVTVSVDASSNYVTSVGGTELPPFSNDLWNGEVAWSYNDNTLGPNAGSGGGLSVFYQQPSWQTGPGVSNGFSNGMRQIPDVSSIASTPFYNLYVQGSFGSYGGTSCAAQFFGGTLALIEEQLNTKLGNIDPALYGFGSANEAIYHDITSGNNGVYHCTSNWDFVTGWGSPDFAKLALAFEGTNTTSTAFHTYSPGLQMFSLPFTFASGDTAGELLDGLVTTSGPSAYVIAAWDNANAAYSLSPTSPAAAPSPGIGYWARFGTGTTGALTAEGAPISTPTFSVSLSPGWNIIGNPYTSAVSIDSLQLTVSGVTQPFDNAAAAGLVQSSFYDYNGSTYRGHSSGDVINSYDGYWIYSFEPSTLIFTSP